MLQASITVSGSELTAELLEKIKSLFQGESKDFEVTILVKPKETQEAVNLRINQSIENIEIKKNVVAFSSDEYDSLVKQLKN
jgi:ERCC4-type nuclease